MLVLAMALGSGDVDGYEILGREPQGEFGVIGSVAGPDSTVTFLYRSEN